jgi:hypothetical protein
MRQVQTAEEYWLPQIKWQLFGTLTFRSEKLPEWKRLSRYFCVIRHAGKATHTNFNRILWVLRQEDGATLGIRHFHFVAGSLRKPLLLPQLCPVLERKWGHVRGGKTEIQVYDRNRDGIGYLLKGITNLNSSFRVSSKFTDGDGQLMISQSVWGYLKKRP